jgi:hypothetical protein
MRGEGVPPPTTEGTSFSEMEAGPPGTETRHVGL